jgi:hypothetical protein
MSIPRKKCTDCDSYFNTFAEIPYCSICINSHCELSHKKDSIGRHRCNSTFDLICRKNKLCIGHYKMMQNFCYVCGHPRSCCDNLSYDDYFYCNDHIPIAQNKVIQKTFNNILNNDVIEKITKYTMS